MPDTKKLTLAETVAEYRNGRRFDDDEINFRCASLIDAGFACSENTDSAELLEPQQTGSASSRLLG
ncbi:hypothetical protein GGI1_23831 [Acidithiobacillus sp. GGI-221]|nr:hypothetical protein GGI1_23831 [Acidithiobacillus sp. GGI-221]